jgi:hypothetical protein
MRDPGYERTVSRWHFFSKLLSPSLSARPPETPLTDGRGVVRLDANGEPFAARRRLSQGAHAAHAFFPFERPAQPAEQSNAGVDNAAEGVQDSPGSRAQPLSPRCAERPTRHDTQGDQPGRAACLFSRKLARARLRFATRGGPGVAEETSLKPQGCLSPSAARAIHSSRLKPQRNGAVMGRVFCRGLRRRRGVPARPQTRASRHFPAGRRRDSFACPVFRTRETAAAASRWRTEVIGRCSGESSTRPELAVDAPAWFKAERVVRIPPQRQAAKLTA